ncbi:MAG: hypothetical protein GTN76_07890 [Candidatus Aenigmarchaeota archaeon]|nr:hypothetical protein [Candidatus Aenigmarchaeota archaeon]
MREVSNNVIAILIVIFIVVFMLQVLVYIMRMEAKVTTEAIGYVDTCTAYPNAQLVPIGNQTAYVEDPYFYDVNYTGNETSAYFTDNTYLFEINGTTGIISFTPNENDSGVHWVWITLYGTCGLEEDSEFVEFNVIPKNYAPILDPIPDFEINQSDHFTYTVTASDPDNDTLTFGDTATFFDIDPDTGDIDFTPTQMDVGVHDVIIWVKDPYDLMDWQSVRFTILDINDCPAMDVIGAQTAIINETYFYDVNASDNDVIPAWSNLTFYDNSTFFNISPITGIINFFVNETYNGTYTINISVSDTICWDWEVISFSVVAVNHPPNITSWYPENYTIEISEGQSQLFWITKEDIDGTTPSTQWYFNGAELSGQINDSYVFYASYDSAGTHNVTVVVSDGLLTDYHNWTLIVKDVPIEPPPSGGVPPTAAPPVCIENWRCSEWSVCPVYEIQTRKCWDENECGTTFDKPSEMRPCTYVPEPSCNDEVQNCHHGSCEILVDCGGPCPPCPTCSDKLKNCHRMVDGTIICEDGIDCGGPCPPCEIVIPAKCGDGVCEKDEIFTCFQDCGFLMGEYLIVIISLSLASILLYRGWYLLALAYRRRKKPILTDVQLLGVTTLRRLHMIQLEIGKKPVRRISAEFAKVMRNFFAKIFEVRRKFTYIELNEIVRRKKLKKDLADLITHFSIRISEIEYGKEEVPVTLLVLTIKDAIRIVEGLTGMKMEDALGERAEKELKKIEPEARKEKIELELKEVKEKPKEKVKFTKEDLKTFDKLRKLIYDGEEALKRRDSKGASEIYSEIRFLYDKIPDKKKEELYEETIKIIKLYNKIMRSLGKEK